MRRTLLATIGLVLVAAPPATAKTRDGLLVPAPPKITFVAGPFPGDQQANSYCATADHARPEVAQYCAANDRNIAQIADACGAADTANRTVYYQCGQLSPTVRGHETGHILDAEVLTDGDRRYFTRIMRLVGAWFQGTGLTAGGQRSPSEWFADWYGNAANGHDGYHEWDAAYSPAPGQRAYKRFRQALDRLGRRHHLPAYRR